MLSASVMAKITTILLFTLTTTAYGQSIVNLMESTIKIPAFGEESIYLGFSEGDKIVLNFEEINKNDLKELEVLEWPSSTKFSDFKVNKVDNRALEVPRTAIYRFRFANGAIRGRVCKIQIQRIPGNTSTLAFNSNVYWRTVTDTIYAPVTERYLVKSDTIISNIVEQTVKISSQNALNGNTNKVVVDIDLPEETIAWSYYIGVGSEGKAAYDNARDKFLTTAAKQASKIEGYGTMAALAIYGLNLFAQVQGENNVKYCLIPDWNNVLLFQSGQSFQIYKQGDVINEAAQMRRPLSGKIYFGFENDNLMESIEVMVRVTTIRLAQTWGTRQVQKMTVSQRQEAYLK